MDPRIKEHLSELKLSNSVNSCRPWVIFEGMRPDPHSAFEARRQGLNLYG